MDLEADNSTTTKLLTLINVSATRSTKRKRLYDSLATESRKFNNKRKSVQLVEDTPEGTVSQPTKTVSAVEAIPISSDTAQPTNNALQEEEDKEDECELHMY